MGDREYTRAAYERVEREVTDRGGPSTSAGEQRHREGRGLDPLVDPKCHGVVRISRTFRKQQPDGTWVQQKDPAMLLETRWDTTSSMRDNVDIGFQVLPRLHDLLTKGDHAPLRRYELQIINSIFGDVCDDYVLCRTTAEMDEKIAELMTLMVPCRDGGDATEDPDYGLFAAAYLTWAEIVKFGLKSYDFTITDAPYRGRIDYDQLKRIFGESVIEKVTTNGFKMRSVDLPTTQEIVDDLHKTAHAFALILASEKGSVSECWRELFGEEHVVVLPSMELLPEVQAVIAGLTEATLSLGDVADFLQASNVPKEMATKVKRAVSHIPLGAQAALPNYTSIPKKGAVFGTKNDIVPLDAGVQKRAQIGAGKSNKKPSQWL